MTHKIFRQSLGRSLSLANLMKLNNHIKLLPPRSLSLSHRNVWWVTSLSQPQPFWLSLKQWSPLPFITRELSSLTNLAAVNGDQYSQFSTLYLPDSKAELSVNSGGIGRVEKDGDSTRCVFSYFLFPIGETFQLPGSFYSLNLHLDENCRSNNFNCN